jgi:hypothetical protein
MVFTIEKCEAPARRTTVDTHLVFIRHLFDTNCTRVVDTQRLEAREKRGIYFCPISRLSLKSKRTLPRHWGKKHTLQFWIMLKSVAREATSQATKESPSFCPMDCVGQLR